MFWSTALHWKREALAQRLRRVVTEARNRFVAATSMVRCSVCHRPIGPHNPARHRIGRWVVDCQTCS